MIRSVPQTGSTNADLLEAARAGAPDGVWLRADRQSGGKGRMGRAWESPAGNFYGSHLVRLQPHDPPAPSLAFVAAVALCEVLMAQAPLIPFTIKWPNDILIGPAKLCGILLERTEDAVVIGIGVNLAHHPEGLPRAVTSLAAQGVTPLSPAAFLGDLAPHFAHWLAVWRSEGMAAVTRRWEALAHPRGTPLTVSLPDGTQLEGAFDGLSADGALCLSLADGGIRAIHAGDVFLV
jgi:BirA family biotin operon repressor/biotin-[acetyl-CoA-carboxylase] ligase